ncbi:MAG: BACON domain-containing carbohydrate-binding protein [Granulosicoccus sp.]
MKWLANTRNIWHSSHAQGDSASCLQRVFAGRSFYPGLILTLLMTLASCSSDHRDTSANSPNVSIAPPGIQLLSRMIDRSTIDVQIILTIDGIPEEVIASPVDSPDGNWTASFAVPPDVPFSLVIVWSAVDVEGNRVNFARSSTQYLGVQQDQTSIDASGEVYDMTAATFDDDGDGESNFDELAAGTPAGAVVQPPITVMPETLELRTQVSQEAGDDFNIQNMGPLSLNYTVESNQSWLTVDFTSNTIASGESQFVEVNAACDERGGERTGILTISGDWGVETVSVVLECQTVTPPLEPVLGSVNPESLSLRAEVSQSSRSEIRIRNSGTASLNYNIETNRSWITTSPDDGNISAGDSESVDVTVSCDTRDETRNGELTIDSNGGERTVPVSIVCTALPMGKLENIATDPNPLNLMARLQESSDGTISFDNTGNASLDFTADADDDSTAWITISPFSGRVDAGGSQTLDITAQCSDVVATRSSDITISDGNTTETVSLSIECSEVPIGRITDVAPDSLRLSAEVPDSGSGSISFRNGGTGILDFSVRIPDEASQWLTITPLTGTLQIDENQTLDVTAQCNEGVGTRSANVIIGSDANEETVEVMIDCASPDVISFNITPDSLDFTLETGQSSSDTISIENTGNVSLDYAVEGVSTFSLLLGINPSSGSIDVGESVQVQVTIMCDEQPGFRFERLRISSGTIEEFITVSIECTSAPPEPDFTISPDFLAIDAPLFGSASDTVNIQNVGAGVLNYMVTVEEQDMKWLSANPANGSIAVGANEGVTITGMCIDTIDIRDALVEIRSGDVSKLVPVLLQCF